jgi:hypothetical protein
VSVILPSVLPFDILYPPPLHELAPVLLQWRVKGCPGATRFGIAVSDAVGAPVCEESLDTEESIGSDELVDPPKDSVGSEVLGESEELVDPPKDSVGSEVLGESEELEDPDKGCP